MNKFHNFSVSEIENLIPWERDIYYELIAEQIRKEAEEQKLRQNAMGHGLGSIDMPQF